MPRRLLEGRARTGKRLGESLLGEERADTRAVFDGRRRTGNSVGGMHTDPAMKKGGPVGPPSILLQPVSAGNQSIRLYQNLYATPSVSTRGRSTTEFWMNWLEFVFWLALLLDRLLPVTCTVHWSLATPSDAS